MTNKKDNAKIVFQVKSGGVKRNDIASLRGDMERENAVLAVLITLEEPSRPMIKDANAAGSYHHEMMGRSYDKIQIVKVKDIIEKGMRLNIPTSLEVLKAAQRAAQGQQIDLDYNALQAALPEIPTQRGFDSAAYLSPVETEDTPRKPARVARAAKPHKASRKTA
jgi:hypothetical protein